MLETATIVLGILYLCGCKVGIALAICAILTGVAVWVGYFQRNH